MFSSQFTDELHFVAHPVGPLRNFADRSRRPPLKRARNEEVSNGGVLAWDFLQIESFSGKQEPHMLPF
jgi:hypothetical protein